ncbi:MAG: YesL family protein [Eubacteriales bacterium]|nr:DUF624 domain-containing protein [Sarcina sp.]MDO4416842.1 YesL family protein [Eubacteriales bacterium]
MRFLQGDTFLTRFLSRLIDLLIVSVLWFLCSIPLVTMGASTTAMYDVTLHLVFDEGSGIVQTFFSSFKKNFVRSTVTFLAFLVSGLFLGADLFAAVRWDTGIRPVLIFMILAACWFWAAAFTHAFPGLAWYEGKPAKVVKKAFLMAMRNGVFTMFIILLNIMPVLFLVRRFTSASFGQWLILYFLLGSGTVAYLASLHIARLFAPEKMEELERREE